MIRLIQVEGQRALVLKGLKTGSVYVLYRGDDTLDFDVYIFFEEMIRVVKKGDQRCLGFEKD
jgi:hypothetical protein